MQETCTGNSGQCPSDTFVSSGYPCLAGGPCQLATICTGASAACDPVYVASTEICRNANDICDSPEYPFFFWKDRATNLFRSYKILFWTYL